MNVIPQDREVHRVETRCGGLTYHFWRHRRSVVILVGCHVVRLSPDEAEALAAAALEVAAEARS